MPQAHLWLALFYPAEMARGLPCDQVSKCFSSNTARTVRYTSLGFAAVNLHIQLSIYSFTRKSFSAPKTSVSYPRKLALETAQHGQRDVLHTPGWQALHVLDNCSHKNTPHHPLLYIHTYHPSTALCPLVGSTEQMRTLTIAKLHLHVFTRKYTRNFVVNTE